jgi:hypothetical protein
VVIRHRARGMKGQQIDGQQIAGKPTGERLMSLPAFVVVERPLPSTTVGCGTEGSRRIGRKDPDDSVST